MGAIEPMAIIFDKMPYLAWIKDKAGKYLEVNQKFVEFCCLEKQEIIGKDAWEIFPGNIAADYQQLDDFVLAHKKSQYMDHVYQETPEGSKWFDTYAAPLLSEYGEVEGTIGFSRKISRRKQLELKLGAQKKFLNTMINTIPDFIVYKDNNSRVLGCNKACLEKFYGFADEQQVIGKTALDILTDSKFATRCLQKDKEALAADKPLKVEEQYFLIDGSVLDVETVKTPYHDEQGQVAGLIAISRDITARKNFVQCLRQREKETQQELNLAARVQRDSLPMPFAGNQVRIETLFLPYQVISGDLFNYKWFEKEQILRGYIVDVSGHGMATALQTAAIKMLLDTSLLSGKEIEKIDFQYINQKLLQYLQQESFAGVLYYEFDFSNALLTVASGGINLFLKAKPGQCNLVTVSGGFFGMFEEADVQIMTWPIKAGEVYCMMSDGVSDIIESQGLRQQQGVTGYTEWLEGLAHTAECSDDFTSVNIEILQVGKTVDIVDIQTEEELKHAQRVIDNYLQQHAASCAIMLEVAINEALNNGLLAGGRVGIRMKRIGNRLLVRVKDGGTGFDTGIIKEKLRLVSLDEELESLEHSACGRGILLMRMICDRLLYNIQGNEVLLVKNLAPEAERQDWSFTI